MAFRNRNSLSPLSHWERVRVRAGERGISEFKTACGFACFLKDVLALENHANCKMKNANC
jgi:hypothetical protein